MRGKHRRRSELRSAQRQRDETGKLRANLQREQHERDAVASSVREGEQLVTEILALRDELQRLAQDEQEWLLAEIRDLLTEIQEEQELREAESKKRSRKPKSQTAIFGSPLDAIETLMEPIYGEKVFIDEGVNRRFTARYGHGAARAIQRARGMRP